MDSVTSVYTESFIKTELRDNIDSLRTVGDCLKYFAETHGDKDSFVFASWKGKEHRVAVRWRELYEKSVCVAKSLIALGKPLF